MEGWKCPGCNSCYGPSVSECYKCNSMADAMNTVTSTTIKIPSKDHKCDGSCKKTNENQDGLQYLCS